MQIIIRSEWIASSAYEQFHLIDNWQWQWGYKLNTVQPPLYTWLFKLIVQVCNFLGLDFKFADSLFRQFLIIANLLISYLILRHYKIDRLNSIFSSAGLFLLSDFSWDNQDYFYPYFNSCNDATLVYASVCSSSKSANVTKL